MCIQKEKEFHVISHTHWDREWYQSFEVFRLRLVDLIDHLLGIYEEYPEFIFHLDAQTVCLEDYLEIRPHRRIRLCELIAAKKLLVGPWYVQNDFYLTSGEATVRNLLIGSRIAEEFGYCDRIGHMPDQFGLIGQLPQIFCQFGIRFVFFGRGYSRYHKNINGEYERSPLPSEFDWESGNGAVVHAVNLSNWYNNAQRFSADPDRALNFLRYVDERLEPCSQTPFRLLMNGVDHLEAQENLLPILGRLQSDLEEGVSIFQSRLSDYAQKTADYLAAGKKVKICGEQREGQSADMLQGTLSSRRYLKVLNTRCQTCLELILEPLFAGVSRRTNGTVAYPADMFTYLWKELLKNHAHDSICGCSTDRVHQDNENRFLRILDAAEDLKHRGLQELLNRISRDHVAENEFLLLVVNSLPYTRSETVEASVRFLLEDQVDGFRILDPDGDSVSYEIVRSVKRNRMTVSPINLPGQIAVEEVTVRFFAKEVPASGYCVYRFVPGSPQSAGLPVVFTGPLTMENEWLAVSVSEAGQVSLTCRESGRIIENLISFEDVADQGDSYIFSAGSEPWDMSSIQPKISLFENSEFRKTIRLEYRLRLPVDFDRKSNCRSETLIDNHLALDISLDKGSPLLNLNGTLENAAKDHRLRVLVHTGVDADLNWSSQPFECIERSRRPRQPDLREDWTHPNTGWVSVRNGDGQFSVLTDGVYDYEHLVDSRHSLAFTWVRSTARIVNDSFGLNSNGVGLSPEWAAPENQCLRSIPFHIACRPGSVTPATLTREWQCWMVPLLTGFDAADPHKFMDGRPCLQDTDLNEIFYRDLPQDEVCFPLRDTGPELKGEVVLSAFKQAENRQGYLLRLFNPRDAETEVTLKNVEHCTEQTLAEFPTEGMVDTNGIWVRRVGPKQIVTLALGKTL